MAIIDMRDFLCLLGEQIHPIDVQYLKYVLQDSFTEDQLAEWETGEDVAITFKEERMLWANQDREALKKALKSIGRNDIAIKLEIYVAAGVSLILVLKENNNGIAHHSVLIKDERKTYGDEWRMTSTESHITTFDGYGYKFICHMVNEDRKTLMENVTIIFRNEEKKIEIHGGAGKRGMKIVKVAQWKTKCKSYYNRYYKTSKIVSVPSDRDMIMNTLSLLCNNIRSRGFVFKNYNIVKHLEFLGYDKAALKAKLGAAPTSKNISYFAYIEKKNVMLICEKVSKSSNICNSLKNITSMVKYFLTLYDSEIQESGVTIIGILIRENEEQEELVECSFCHLFSPLHKFFESPATFKIWWSSIETYEGWWNLANTKKQNNLFDNLVAEILCFMAVQEKGLPTLTDDKSQQFRQTYFLYTPQQMDIHFSDAKHVIIQGSYGSGKSVLGLKKLEVIWKSLKQNEKIMYINFDRKSNLHFLMEKNVKDYVGISSRKINRISGIKDILESPGQLIYVCHNSEGENLSAILQETMRLNKNMPKKVKTNCHLIIEEYDGERLSHVEAARITKLVKSSDLKESNIILLAQPLMKTRSWKKGKKSYERETCMFHELKNTFKIVKLEEVLRCSNEICGLTKCTQNFVQNKDSVFKTKMDKLTIQPQQKLQGNEKHIVSHSVSESNYPDARTSTNENVSYPSENSDKSYKGFGPEMDLDQAFKRSSSLRRSKSKIVSKFGFLCEPRKGVDIEGLKPNLVEFSEDISLTSDIAVIALALALKKFIGKNEATTILHMPDEQPTILRRTFQVLPRLLNETFFCTQDMEAYLRKNSKFKMVFCSNLCSVNGMEFDHVVIVVSLSEYYLKYYLPQAISRCTYDLTLVLLPKDEVNTKKCFAQKLSNFFSRAGNEENKETVANMIKELKHECLMKQMVISECKACEKNHCCYSILNETNDKQTLEVHTHSDQYKDHLSYLANYTELEDQLFCTSASALADAKIQDFLKTCSQQQTESASVSEVRMDASLNKGSPVIDQALVKRFLGAALSGDVGVVVEMMNAGVPVHSRSEEGYTALQLAAMSNRTDVVQELLQKGADVNKQTDGGWTPLHYAAHWNSTNVIRVLLQQGASTDIKDKYGTTPLDIARELNKKEVVRLLEKH